MVQIKMNIKSGAKLDVIAAIEGSEVTLKTSCFKAAADRILFTTPLVGGKSFTPEKGATVVFTWDDASHHYEFSATVMGSEKIGIRSYITAKHGGLVSQIERRAHARVVVRLPAELYNFSTAPDGTRYRRAYPCLVSDISAGGAALYTDAPTAVGETLELSILLQGSKHLTLRGDVCWGRPAARGSGFTWYTGLQFVAGAKEESAALLKLLASYAESDA